MVGGRGGLERDASTEPSGHRVGVGDGARGEHGACDVHGTGSGGAHGMRGDGVGVGDIGQVPGDARSVVDAAGDDDGFWSRRKRDAGVVGGLSCGENNHKRPVPYFPTFDTQDLAAMRRLELRYFTEREGEI